MSERPCTMVFDGPYGRDSGGRIGALVISFGGNPAPRKAASASGDRGRTGSIEGGHTDDRSLAAAPAASGDAIPSAQAEALELRPILEALHPESFAWAVTCSRGNVSEATDVLQTAYVKVLNGEARFDSRSSSRTWFFGVVRRTAQERRRRDLLGGRILLEFARRFASPASVAPVQQLGIEEAERARSVRAALGHLTERQRQVLALVFEHDMTLDEAAQALGIAPGSARSHYERGKQRLRALMTRTIHGTSRPEDEE